MSSFLPWFFVVLATILLATALLTLWQSVRAAFGLSDLTEVENEGDEDERRALLEEKEALLANLRDLSFDRDGGKLSEEDFHELDEKLRAQAREVLKKLDVDVAAQRSKAEAMIAERFAREGLGASTTPAVPAAEFLPNTCPGCGVRNDADAAFCKKCGRNLSLATEGA